MKVSIHGSPPTPKHRSASCSSAAYTKEVVGVLKVYYYRQKRQILHGPANKPEGSGLATHLLSKMQNVRVLQQFLLHLIVVSTQYQLRKTSSLAQ